MEANMNNRTPEQKFDDLLNDEYEAAIKDNDEYYEQIEEEEAAKEAELEEKVESIVLWLAFPISAALGYGVVQLLKLIIPGWGG